MKLARLLVGGAALLVPRPLRREWREEWAGELEAARERGSGGAGALRLALGAVPDAWAARRAADDIVSRRRARERTIPWGADVTALGRELRRAGRALRRAPGYALTAIVTLALGLGAVSAIFSVVNAVLLEPLPYPGSERLVEVSHRLDVPGTEGRFPTTRHGYLHIRDGNRVFEAVGGYRPLSLNLAADGGAERVDAALATPGLMAILGARPALGRLLDAGDSEAGASPVAVLSYGIWQRRFGADPAVLGRRIRVGEQEPEVVGVMMPGVSLPQRGVDVWLPYLLDPDLPVTDQFRLETLARLESGRSMAEAEADVARLNDLLDDAYPGTVFGMLLNRFDMTSHVMPLRTIVVGDVERALWIIFVAVGIVLLIAAANAANLFLVRTEGRSREIAVRTALGAGRRRLTAHFMAESLLLALAGAVAGLALAWAGVALLRQVAPPSLPRLDGVGIGWRTVGFTAGVAFVVGLALGVYPTIRFAGRNAAAALGSRGAERRGEARGDRVRRGLVIAQVALAMVLLGGAGLMIRSFDALRSVEPGFDARGVLTVELALPPDRYGEPERVASFYDLLIDRVEGLAGVSAAAVGQAPVPSPGGCSAVRVGDMPMDGSVQPPCLPFIFVSPGYFELLGIGTDRGRIWDGAAASRAGAVLVSANAAERLWPEADALGQELSTAPFREPFDQVIGVVEPVRGGGPAQPATEMLYYPILGLAEQGYAPQSIDLLVRTAPGAELELAPAVRAAVRELDPLVAIGATGSLEAALDRSMVRTTFTMYLLAVAAVTALALGLIGLYGVIASRVRSRRAEIGVRMAIGARDREIRWMVVGDTLALAAGGTAIGTLLSLGVTRVLESLLHGVAPRDPATLAAAAALLAATAAIAGYIPAHRATRIDPADALRIEG